DAATILRIDPIALLYVATVLAQRLDSANRGLLELKRQVQASEPLSVIGQTVEKIEELLGATGANLMYAGYPYGSVAPGAPRSCNGLPEELRSAIARPSPTRPFIYGLGITSHPNGRVAHFFAGRESASQTSAKVRPQVRLRGRRRRGRGLRP